MRIDDLFRLPIDRRIEEVIKVDLDEEDIVAGEIDEYVVTDHIAESFELVLDRYQDTILKPDEGTNVWISGFFGSGKSSFAKVLGYLLSNPTVSGRTATERFLARVHSPTIEALLNTIHAQVPSRTVFVDLSTGRNVAREGESVVLPLYRALLASLGYSTNVLLAELEYDLETDGELDDFVEAFSKIPGGRGLWAERRNVGLARGEASHAMHLLRSDTYPHADSWARSAADPPVTANWFAKRAVELLSRRGEAATRLVFVVDEVGQYVSRSVERMLDLQGLAEAVQKQRGKLWLAVTSQEKLDDVVDALESRQIELARVQARFPIRVDLLPADIDEVAGKRVLDKTPEGAQAVREAFRPDRNKLNANVRLTSPTRGADLAEDEAIRLYPMLPYQIQLLIDAVSARRTHGGAGGTLGGSNRTIIKLAQQFVVHPKVGLGGEEVGGLVTIDRAYDLLESIIPTAWQAEIRQVSERHGIDSFETRVTKAIALTMDVPALPLDVGNLAALLHHHYGAESLRDDVQIALEVLLRDEVVRHGDDGYRLQSPQEKDWEKTRKGIEPRPADAIRLRRQVLRDALAGLSVTEGRTFKVTVTVEGERVLDGDIPLMIEEADVARREDLRATSRDPDNGTSIWWVFEDSSGTYDTLVELYRSQQMIARKDTAAKRTDEIELLGEERNRERRYEQQALARLTRDLLGGQIVFQGRVDDVAGNDLKAAAQEAVRSRVRQIYTRLDEFSAPVTRAEVLAVLRADDLRGLPDYLRDGGIGLVRTTPEGVELVTDRDPLAAFVNEIRQQVSYGNEATGSWLERTFAHPRYGAPIEVIQALAAAAIRAGLVEAIHQGARISRADDPRLDRVLGTLPAFRAASFALQVDDIPLEARTQVAERLAELTGTRPSPVVDALGPQLRDVFLPDREACSRVAAALRGLGVHVPEEVTRTASILDRLRDASDKEAVRTASETWADLVAGRGTVQKLDEILDAELETLREALDQIRLGDSGLDTELQQARANLEGLLGADLSTHLAEIKTLTVRLKQARDAARLKWRDQLAERVAQVRSQLTERFTDLEASTVQEALRPLDGLLPTEDELTRLPLDTLESRLDAVQARSHRARRLLEEVSAAGAVARVEVAALVGDPITNEEELAVALDRIRQAVETELGKDDVAEVRLA